MESIRVWSTVPDKDFANPDVVEYWYMYVISDKTSIMDVSLFHRRHVSIVIIPPVLSHLAKAVKLPAEYVNAKAVISLKKIRMIP